MIKQIRQFLYTDMIAFCRPDHNYEILSVEILVQLPIANIDNLILYLQLVFCQSDYRHTPTLDHTPECCIFRFAAAEKLAKAVNKPSVPGSVLLK